MLPDAVPLPRGVKLKLSVEYSKITRANCGLDPARFQTILVCATASSCSAAVSSLKRAKRLRVCPPIIRKLPPTKTLPSACTPIEETSPLALGLNESAKAVAASSRAMRLRACPPIFRNAPPTRILPSACTAIELILLFALGLNESARPVVGSSRAM